MDARTPGEVAETIAAQRVILAAAQAELAALAVEYADLRIAEQEQDVEARPRAGITARPGEFVADELSVILAEQPWDVRLLLARTRRVRSGLPEVQRASSAGQLDAERVRLIDRAAKLCTEAHTAAILDEQASKVAPTKTPKQLKSWLDRFLAAQEPDAFGRRHRRAVADRRVTTSRSSMTGMGYVTGEVSAADAASIDLRLTSLARQFGAGDPRTEQQRRSDLFAELLLGETAWASDHVADVEVEVIDPDTGEYLGTRREPAGHLNIGSATPLACTPERSHPVPGRRGSPPAIGIVVPLTSLLGLDDRPGELADRSGCLPAETVRDIAAEPGTLFYRLLTDERGRLLDVTELGRFPSDRLGRAVRFRNGTCGFPTCTVPAEVCDIDHHEPEPRGPTAGRNLDPGCRRHHRGKTFAGLASRREEDSIIWTLPTSDTYQCLDEPFTSPTSWGPGPAPEEDPLDAADVLELAELLELMEPAA